MKKFLKIYSFYAPVLAKNKKNMFLFTGLFMVGNVVANVVSPLFYKNIIDEASAQVTSGVFDFNVFLVLVGGLLVTLLFASIGRRLGSYFYSLFDANISNAIHAHSFELITKQSYSFFSNNFIGTLSGKVNRLSQNFRNILQTVYFGFILLFFDVLITLIILFNQSTEVGFVFLTFFVFFVAYSFIFIKKLTHLDTIRAQRGSERSGVLSDILTNVLNVKIFSSKKHEISYYRKSLKRLKKSQLDSWLFQDRVRIYKNIIFIIFEVSIMITSLYFFTQGKISLGTLSLVQIYATVFISNAWHLDKSMKAFVGDVSDTHDAIDVVAGNILVCDPKRPEKLTMKKGTIRFKDVSFTYPEGDHVFENFNLEIPQGQSVGVVGKSGSGKTTITKLLQRFFDVDGGSISIDGQDIQKVRQDNLRSCISYIPQESILFHRSVYDNIAYGNMKASKKEVIEASKFAHADEFITQFEKGYKTKVGERGMKLSGGQRQRVAIARAMLKRHAPILVMDEATSSLDSISEQYIQNSFEKLMKGRTTIVIAHRLSTIRKMDRIIVLDKGKVVEEGSHEELLSHNGYYARLWESQVDGVIPE